MVTSASLTIDTKGGKWINSKCTVVKVALTRTTLGIDFHGKREVH